MIQLEFNAKAQQCGEGKFANEADGAGDNHVVRFGRRPGILEIVAPLRFGVKSLLHGSGSDHVPGGSPVLTFGREQIGFGHGSQIENGICRSDLSSTFAKAMADRGKNPGAVAGGAIRSPASAAGSRKPQSAYTGSGVKNHNEMQE
jgi:hypothetical protein